jgi:hypothetical protein
MSRYSLTTDGASRGARIRVLTRDSDQELFLQRQAVGPGAACGTLSRRDASKIARYEVPGKALKRRCILEGCLILTLR